MKVVLCFQSFELGVLQFKKGLYIYSSNLANEKLATRMACLNLTEYDLFNSIKKTSNQLFSIFSKIVEDVKKRKDLMKMLKIEQTDTDMMVLFKLGKFKQDKSKFYVIS
ncbi:MAG TPA: hypothetical protein DCZ34_03070 [Clostridiales bacterium]|nr:hypothetical protein [Clostridiales bacterium]